MAFAFCLLKMPLIKLETVKKQSKDCEKSFEVSKQVGCFCLMKAQKMAQCHCMLKVP